MDKNIDFQKLLSTATSLPMVQINRENFLKSCLQKYYSDDIVQKAIDYNPAYAGISVEEINKIAKSSIDYETTKVTALSFASGIPGGFAMIGTVPADLIQYFGHILRILQKLAQKALTKGTIYPIVKRVSIALDIKMTKDIFAKNVSKVIPVIGGFACGGLTLATYKPMAEKLRKYLSTLKFADVEFYKDNDNIIASY